MPGPIPMFRSITAIVLHDLSQGTIILPPGDARLEGQQPDGSFAVRVQEPDIDACHIALGRYMDAWNHAETALINLLREVLSLSREAIPPLQSGLGTRGQLDAILNVGEAIFDESTQAECIAITERIKRANTLRNRIVHGYWMLETAISEFPVSGIKAKTRAFRMYDPPSPVIAAKLRNPKEGEERCKWMFSVSRIKTLVLELDRLAIDTGRFRAKVFGGL